MTSTRDILVLGGSAGAAEAVTELLKRLPADLPATIFVALHLSPLSKEWMSARLGRSATLQVESPEQEQRTERGHVYLARPDHHLIVKEGSAYPSRGPRENLWRPAIDVLFRTAAVAYGPRVIGVLMSGELDDGTAGLQAIKACGGLAVIQEPTDAEFPTMPSIALSNVEVDHRANLEELPALLEKLVHEPAPSGVWIPEEIRKEAALAEAPENSREISESFGPPTMFTCPECGGPLWSHGPDGTRLRCLVGHSFGIQSLLQGLEDGIDQTLWAAIRMFEQRVNITRMMAERERSSGREQRAALYESRAEESHRHAQRLRELHLLRSAAELTQASRISAAPAASPSSASRAPSSLSRDVPSR